MIRVRDFTDQPMQSRSLERGAARKGADDVDPTETTATADGEAVSSSQQSRRRDGEAEGESETASARE